MEIRCEKCDVSFAYADVCPQFCQHCGTNLLTQAAVDSRNMRTMQIDVGTIPPKGIVREQAPSLDKNHPDVGMQIDQYKLIRPLGAGGMGIVWEASEDGTGRRVALKYLLKQMISDESSVQRFLREAKLAAQISHPRVTFIFGAGTFEDQPYIVMELMPGKTLADEIDEQGPFDVPRAVDSTLDAIEGLIAAHRMGVIHRDVKPSNCFLDTDNTVKIGDFGLSKSMGRAEVNLTQTGTFMGTPSYSAPEQVRCEPLDGRTDVYALGGTLYCLLTGQPPFVGDAMSVTAQIVSDPPKPPRDLNPDIPYDLELIILKCLEKDPNRRFESFDAMRTALLPFASRGTSLSTFGRRLAAFMTDFVLLQGVFAIVLIGLAILQSSEMDFFKNAFNNTDNIRPLRAAFVVFGWLAMVAYFAVYESFTGRTIGKRMMGLKVVNRHGERPPFWSSLVRALAIPGCFGITIAWGIYSVLTENVLPDAASLIMLAGSQIIAFLIPTTICLATMRVANRLKGLHGIISGTRVVHVADEQLGTFLIPRVQTQSNTIEIQNFGPYMTHDLLGESADRRIFLGHDTQLDREVWIVSRNSETSPTADRINLARPARPRWLAGDTTDGRRWDVYEAVQGAPVQILTGSKYKLGWQQYRSAICDLAVELQSAINDETLPDELSLAQIWIGQDGCIKLIDRPLVSVVVDDHEYASGDKNQSKDDVFRAVNLLQEFAGLMLRSSVLPISGQRFLTELRARLRDEDTLEWAISELENLCENMAELAWDSRLGVLGVTIGLEGVTYGMLSLTIFTLLLHSMPFSAAWSFGVAFWLSLAMPLAMGAWMRGPVFRFMAIDICDKYGGLANRFVCAMRNALAWCPLIVVAGAVAAFSSARFTPKEGAATKTGHVQSEDVLGVTGNIAAGEVASPIEPDNYMPSFPIQKKTESDLGPVPGSFAHALENEVWLWRCLVLALIAAIALLIEGVFLAFRNPTRGLQDYLCQTHLSPR